MENIAQNSIEQRGFYTPEYNFGSHIATVYGRFLDSMSGFADCLASYLAPVQPHLTRLQLPTKRGIKMQDNNQVTSSLNHQNIKAKFVVDILSATSVLLFLAFWIWAQFDNSAPSISATGHVQRPLYLWLAVANIIPCIFGMTWLTWRYRGKLENRFPLIGKSWFLVLIFLAVLAFNTILHHMER